MNDLSGKIRFAAYLNKRGYNVLPGTILWHNSGVTAQIKQEPDLAHFSRVEQINPKAWFVKIDAKDYDNISITDGKF